MLFKEKNNCTTLKIKENMIFFEKISNFIFFFNELKNYYLFN